MKSYVDSFSYFIMKDFLDVEKKLFVLYKSMIGFISCLQTEIIKKVFIFIFSTGTETIYLF